MDFYARKERSIRIVNKCINTGATTKEILKALLNNGGLGKRFLTEYLETIEDDLIDDEGVIQWKKE